MNAPAVLDGLREVDGPTERAIIEMVRLLIRQKSATRDVDHWERGWTENLEAYRQSGDIADLRPRYIRQGVPLRLNGRFVIADDPDYEWKWYRRFLAETAERWLVDARCIYEFGCGSGHNVAWLARRFPSKLIIGCDWSTAAVDIVREMRMRSVTNVEGRSFDFYCPEQWSLDGCIVLTVGAMEQTGTRWQPMLDYLLAAHPKRVVHIEPLRDVYFPGNPVDQTAIEAHDARGFWTGYLDALRRLREAGRVDIEHVERTGLGSLLVEGYTQLIWRPL